MTTWPRVFVLTDRLACERAGRTLLETVAAAVEAAECAVVLREKDLSFAERLQLGTPLARAVATAGSRLVVASDVSLAAALGADAIHVAGADPAPAVAVPPPAIRRFGRSCHNGPELAEAAAQGAEYAFISPVFSSQSKPGYGPPLGVDGLSALSRNATIPVYALGGVTPRHARVCLEASAHGIAVMTWVMGSRHPTEAMKELKIAMR